MSLPEPIAKNHCARCHTRRHVLSIHHTYVPSLIDYRRYRQYEQDHPPLARTHLQSVPLCASTINAMRGECPTRLCQASATHGHHVVTCLIDVVPWSARPWRLRKRVDAVYPQVPPAQSRCTACVVQSFTTKVAPCRIKQSSFRAAVAIGLRPTFNNERPSEGLLS